mgnify:CR=1 FL=1
MANENKNINELVDRDEDPTSELESLTERHLDEAGRRWAMLESDENTSDYAKPGDAAATPDALRAALAARDARIEQLEYEYEQVHSRWRGLRAELDSREQLTASMRADLRNTESRLDHAQLQVRERDLTIDMLKSRLRELKREFDSLQTLLEEARNASKSMPPGDEAGGTRQKLLEYEGTLASLKAAFSGMRNQQKQTEAYADSLRRQLTDLRAEAQDANAERLAMRMELGKATSKIASLETKLVAATRATETAENALAAVRDVHEQEMRLLRYELSEAQETISENSQISEQLASDLVQNRGYKVELERMLTDTEQQGRERIETLENQVVQLEATLADYENKLETKTNAINALLDELAKKNQTTEEHDDADFDEPAQSAERAVERSIAADRVSRLLVGRIDDQELRFPLFKNRLTIGRTQQNDIYLKAPYISRRHAVIVTESCTTRIIDWGSKNGVYVNSKRVTEHFLKSGDRVTIGTIEFRYEELPKRDAS